jgi:hypothetical protein
VVPKSLFLDAACMLGMASSDKEDAVPPHWPRPSSSLAAFEWTDPNEWWIDSMQQQ